ncbi:MAG TPA: GNAT family N-acetyltransferase [Thermoflexia bacterium]|nr:GNAT family N-acetyltransferase [Thermoflexia bacterium]
MVAAILRRRTQGIVPFDPLRHLGQVADLMEIAFAEEMGPAARYVLRRMRQMARWGSLSLLLWEMEGGNFGPSGFVWLEEDRVVGNISLRRAAFPGGWMIGNVAVHPDWRGRGIGRALVEAALETVGRRGGAWVGLEVRDDNPVARRLYERLGFEPVGTTVELIRPAGLPWPKDDPLPSALPLRRARGGEGRTLYRLAQEGLSRPHRDVLEIRPAAYQTGWEAWLSAWLEGRREDWWVALDDGRIVGAVGLLSRRPARYHRIEVLCRAERQEDLGPRLVRAGVAFLSRRRRWETVTILPGPRQALEPVFADLGFQRLRRLVQMRRIIGHRLEVAG